jgi:nucleoside-diphosphate-sugar epimerase
MTKKLFCFGYGYSCDYLGHELLKQPEWLVSGTTRTQEKRETLRKRGVQAHIFDYEHPLADPSSILDGTTHLLISTPPGDGGDPAFKAHAQDIAKIKTLEWVGYLSTTGVYGDREGRWVDEASELRPSSKRGSRRVKAEEQWLSLLQSHNLPVHIFRLAGIYGPGRSALDTIRAGSARCIEKPGHAFSRIHVEDIVQILQASIDKPSAGAIYNLCDDNPAPSHEIIAHACALLGRPVPALIPFEQADLTPMARSFYNDNKRVKNEKIKTDLGVALKYPDYKSGLEACQNAEQHAVQLFKKF